MGSKNLFDCNYIGYGGHLFCDLLGRTESELINITDIAMKHLLNSTYGYNPTYTITGKYKLCVKPDIEKVIFNDPATIILWSDKTKTVVKCQEGETYDPEKGVAMAICKKMMGNKGRYYNEFKKWLPEEKKEEVETVDE